MGLEIISGTMEAVRSKPLFTEEEKHFVVEFAFKTNDRDLTNMLIDELANPDRDFAEIRLKYRGYYEERPNSVEVLENLLFNLQIYRLEEERTIKGICEVLKAYGVDVDKEEIKEADIGEIKEKIK